MRLSVLHLLYDLDTAGVQILVRNLVARLDPARVRPLVCAWKRGGAVADEIAALGIKVFTPSVSPTRRDFPQVLRWLESLVKREGVAVLHAHMSDSAFWSGALSLRKGVPYLVTYHSNRLLPFRIDRQSPYGRLRRYLQRWAATRAAANVACSPEVKQRLGEELALPPERVEVILNGVPVPRPEEVAAAAMRRVAAREGAGAAWPIIVTVGRLVDIKGQDQLVAAAPALLARFPAAQLVLVGDGPRLEDWRAQARRLGVEKRVVFTGHVERVEPLIESAHLYVSTSHYEGISIALLEAMARRVPVVASDVPGNRSVVVPEVNGKLYPLGDTAALVEAITELALDGEKAERLAHCARTSVEGSFSDAAMARSYEGIYARVVEASG